MTATPLALDSAGADIAFLLARVLFGAIMAFTGLNHFMDHEGTTAYAEMKGVPAASLAVPLSGVLLVLGGLGIALGAFPVLAAGALALFLLVTTPLMHDFWAVPEDQTENEMTHFLKNVALMAGSLAFLALGTTEWAYAVGVGL